MTASASVIVGAVGPARADTYAGLPIGKVGEVVVDGTHQRVLISDPSTSKIIQTDYNGAVTAARDGYPSVEDLLLSADRTRLYAAWPEGHAIVALDATDLSEITRYDVGSAVRPHTLAAAGDRIWFGYESAADAGGIGSLDLRGDDPRVTLDDGTSKWLDAPRLATAANKPGVLAAAGRVPAEGDFKAAMAVFDVTGDAPQRTARVDFYAKPYEIALTPDGSTLLYPWNDTLVSRRTSDLATTSTVYKMTHTANAVDVAPDGTVAGGASAPYDPDLYVFTPGNTLVRRYELPDTGKASWTSDTLDDGALAWEPGSGQLFAVAYNDVDKYSLRRLTAPRKSVPTLTLTGPTSGKRAVALALTGKLTSSLPLPTGTAVTVTRTDPEYPKGRAMSTVRTATGGAITVKDLPPAGGRVTYTIRYAGDATHEPAVAVWSVQIAKSTPVLTLNRKTNTVFSYGSKVSVTAHLGGAYKNRTVAIYVDPYGADQPNKAVRVTTVNSKGDLAATITLTRNSRISAVFTGDTRVAAKSVSIVAQTRVRISQTAKGQYKKANNYNYFHAKTQPRFTTTMTYMKGRSQHVVVEYYAGGSWQLWGYGFIPLASNGTSTATIVGAQRNIRMRVKAGYVPGGPGQNSGDALNVTTYTPWTYFIVTK
ncbi:hypothetical protein [Paractinoplanes deccanensis]|uniref:hypothetical protein n=1 Tax=Paractinoplanes deccanensis TaxID=113561 RepID=UPI001940EE5F|nr:hypothetical protein [Actinoplanes deccanensis]